MSTYLLDTTLLIDAVRQRPEALEIIVQVLQGQVTASYSPVTEAELWAGLRNRTEEMQLEALLGVCEFAPLTSPIARRAGSILRRRSQIERTKHFSDAVIGATAAERGEPVVTADRAIARVIGSEVDYRVYR